MKSFTRLLSILMLLLFSSTSYATVPHLINYQGRLTDSAGIPLNGSYVLTFRIYDAETAGNLLWEEMHSGVVIQKGIFGILLGSVTALNLPFDKQYFLEIKVGAEVMSPRQRITNAGYAIRAEKAERLIDASAIDSGTIPTARLGSGTADANKFLRGDQSWQDLPTLRKQLFTSSGTFTVPAGVTRVYLTMIGGGGGGNGAASSPPSAGRGGGGGSYLVEASGSFSWLPQHL